MNNQYADLLNRQKNEYDALHDRHCTDIEKIRQMGRPLSEINQLQRTYLDLKKNLANKHTKERQDFLNQGRPKQQEKEKEGGYDHTEEAQKILEQFRKQQQARKGPSDEISL